MMLAKEKECFDPLLPHMHIFIVPSGLANKDIEHAMLNNSFDKMVSVSPNGLICDKSKDYVDFVNGVCLSLCIISNKNNDNDGLKYPSNHNILGDMSPYYSFIEKNIQKDFSLIKECSEMLCFMVLPEDDTTETIH